MTTFIFRKTMATLLRVVRWLESFMMLPVILSKPYLSIGIKSLICINKGELLYYVQGFTNPLASEVHSIFLFTRRNRRRGRNLWRTAIGLAIEVQNSQLQTLRTKAFVKE
jgi:hypothetical protein